jgi:riboflavin kinase/FMN adenylyltransferase
MRVIDWDDFMLRRADPGPENEFRALTIGVFDGVHRGHQILIRRICESPYLPTVVTFRQNPRAMLNPEAHAGDIYSLERKLQVLELLGVRQTVLIDFSPNFSRMSGKDFVELLLRDGRTGLLALGRNFRCGRGQDTGVREIAARAGAMGAAVWIADPVMEGAERISSSRIRRAIAAGNFDEAALLLGRPYEPRP